MRIWERRYVTLQFTQSVCVRESLILFQRMPGVWMSGFFNSSIKYIVY
jgi:hypothetical protein